MRGLCGRIFLLRQRHLRSVTAKSCVRGPVLGDGAGSLFFVPFDRLHAIRSADNRPLIIAFLDLKD